MKMKSLNFKKWTIQGRFVKEIGDGHRGPQKLIFLLFVFSTKRGSFMVSEINMGVCPR